MPGTAWACRISRDNYSVIASENPHFDMQELLDWVEEHQTGYFLRDETSVFDCKYITDEVFFQMYIFAHKDKDALFREVVSI